MRVIIIGGGGHAKVVVDLARLMGLSVVGVVDPHPQADRVLDVPVVGDDDALAAYDLRDVQAVVAIGDNWTRSVKVDDTRRRIPRTRFATLVHPQAIVASTARLREGTVVMGGAVVSPDARVGRHGIVNTGSVIEHDCELGDFASVAPGSTLGGGVHIGIGSAIGLGAIVLHGRRVGDHAVIGAGAVVTRDIPANVVAYGVPARVVRDRNPREPSF